MFITIKEGFSMKVIAEKSYSSNIKTLERVIDGRGISGGDVESDNIKAGVKYCVDLISATADVTKKYIASEAYRYLEFLLKRGGLFLGEAGIAFFRENCANIIEKMKIELAASKGDGEFQKGRGECTIYSFYPPGVYEYLKNLGNNLRYDLADLPFLSLNNYNSPEDYDMYSGSGYASDGISGGSKYVLFVRAASDIPRD